MINRSENLGFFSRVRNSLVGVVIGLLFLPGSVFLLGWNEYRTIHRTKGLLDAERVVVEIADPFEITDQSSARLVHFSGKATTDELLSDTEFGISLPVLQLERQVEMYQWVERKESKTRNKVGGGSETVTTYSYDQKWQTDRVDSDRFEERQGHDNPVLKYGSQTQNAQKATVGAFNLRPDLVGEIDAWHDIPIGEVPLSEMSADQQAHFKVDSNWLYYSPAEPEPSNPKIGDHRIRFRKVDPTDISLLSMQDGRNLAPFKTPNGELVEKLEVGKLSAAEMFNTLKSENTMIAWLLRFAGWGISVVGFLLVTGPLKTLANFVPMFGSLVGTATFAISLLLGSCLSLTVIGLAWMAVRPLFATSILLAVGVMIYLFTRRKQSPIGPPPLPAT